MDHSQSSLSSVISAQCSSPSEGSLAQSLRCEAKIANLTYRITFLSNFLSAAQQILDLVSTTDSIFSLYYEQIIILVELARKTLESAGVIVYSWASCPAELLPHKEAYFQLLKMLQLNERHVGSKLQRRLRVLLMPLTSHFSSSKKAGLQQPIFRPPKSTSSASTPPSPSTSLPNTNHKSASHEAASSSITMMPPPDGFPPPERAANGAHTRRNHSRQRPNTDRLWHVSELVSTSKTRRHRSLSPHRSGHPDIEYDRENVAPEPIPFRQAPTKQRFGIFMTGKSSIARNQNRKDRNTRPTH
ncbi:hypothetical protein CVT26_001496 [Gymnopilus dilepis]|uniref:Uncharacterized protein n=1 Tax=Gymnopilus dilepis TaxID=231916 RepID=A0A409WB91_9AGAR|nr:hypothetical protein CVT26_001496 [Gymnopilus dilepis]